MFFRKSCYLRKENLGKNVSVYSPVEGGGDETRYEGKLIQVVTARKTLKNLFGISPYSYAIDMGNEVHIIKRTDVVTMPSGKSMKLLEDESYQG